MENASIPKPEEYQIAICHDGKFAVTFDTANLRIRILENTDHYPYKKNDTSQQNSDYLDAEMNKEVVYFKINDDLTINNIETITERNIDNGSGPSSFNTTENKKFRWSLDISYIQNDKYSITLFVAVSRIAIDEDMKGKKNNDAEKNKRKLEKRKYKISDRAIKIGMKTEITKGTAIYRLKLIEEDGNYKFNNNEITSYYSSSISGICKFVDNDLDKTTNNDIKQVSIRFLALNFHEIYNYKYNDDFIWDEKFNYPTSTRRELNYWNKKGMDCMDQLLSCIYHNYLLVKQYKHGVQSLEVYHMAEMKLETTVKSKNMDSHLKKHYRNAFSISNFQFCFTQGRNSIKAYLMENGLEIASKKFDEIEEIHSLEFINNGDKLLIIGKGPEVQEDGEILVDEFQKKKQSKEKLMLIIWDLYNTGEVEKVDPKVLDNSLTIKNLNARLARTLGNILQIDDEGKVTSVLKKVEKNKTDEARNLKAYLYNRKDGNHIIHYDKDFEPIVSEKESWVIDDYERNSYCLYQNKEGSKTSTLQLIVGRSTVQIWHQIHDKNKKVDDLPNKGEPFLEYIWTNGIPVDQEREETRLRIDEMKYELNDFPVDQGMEKWIDEKKNGLNDFCLKVYWYEKSSKSINNKRIKEIKKNIKENKENEEEIIEEMKIIDEENEEIKNMELDKNVQRKEKTIQWKDINEKVKAVKHACRALEFLNKRKEENNYIIIHQHEEMVAYIKYIIWRFVNYKPDQYKLLDVRHNVMKNLILGDCNHLIKFILFRDDNLVDDNLGDKYKKYEMIKDILSDDFDKEKCKIHIPKSWPSKKFINDELDNIEIENDMELAIYHYKGREIKDTIVVAYLLEYYSGHATDDVGWMNTVSVALPLLFKYNYDDYARKLFRKKCFADQDYFSAQDPYEIIPEDYQERRDIKFTAFRPKLQSVKLYNFKNYVHSLKHKVYRSFENFDNDLGKSPLALRMVPLPGFTISNISQEKMKYNFRTFIPNSLLFILVPRWYNISRNEKEKLSPFSRMVLYENNDDIYDNPATEAIIDFHWPDARNFFFFLFLRFFIFGFCFVLVSWAYLVHEIISEGFRNFLVLLIVIFYYLAIYLLITEGIQLCYHGPRKYFGDIFNWFDIVSIVLPVIVMSIILQSFQLSDGFGSVETDETAELMVGISFSIFLLWIEMISYLRLISNIAIYIYYVIIIFKSIYPFILFIVIVAIAFAHTMYFLLKNSKNITTKDNTFSGVATNTLTNEKLNIALKADFDPTSRVDNPFSFFPTAIESAYFWLNSNWVLKDFFDYWVIDVYTLIASVFLVTILQNMLIAFMSGVYENAETKGRQTLLRYKANKISDFEALYHIYFWKPKPVPRYIYYISESKDFEDWYESRKNDQNAIYKDFEEKSTFTKHTFKKTNYDKYSIWKFDDKHKD